MAFVGVALTADVTELRELQVALGKIFTPADKARILAAALRKAVKPVEERLKQVTPIGPTGNLKRAVRTKVVSYSKDGAAVGLVGYLRTGEAGWSSAAGGSVGAGPDRAFHQWWLENGTKARVIDEATPAKPYNRASFSRNSFPRNSYTMTRKGKTFAVRAHTISAHSVSGHAVSNVTGAFYYASSYRRLGPFRMVRTKDGAVQTTPPYPYAFFKKSRNPITLPPMKVGGTAGQPPIETAYNMARDEVAAILQQELRISLERAFDTISKSSAGTVIV